MFVIVEEMMPSEAVLCSAPSKLFRGLCFNMSDNNCSVICKKEGFSFGNCKGFKCICQKDCNVGGGGDGGDASQGPPQQGGGSDGGDAGQGPPEQGDGGDGDDEGDAEPPEQGGGEQPASMNRKYLIKA